MTVINSNSAALRAQNGSRIANQELSTAMARLSSGNRINSAADDAAGLAISNSMTSQITGMNQAVRNANDGVSLAQTADGSLSEVTNNLQRIRELAVQSASGTYSDDDRANMQAEVTELAKQINTSLTGAQFNGVALFNTTAGGGGTTTNIQVGANSGDTVAINVGNLSLNGIVSLAAATTTSTATLHTVAAGDNGLIGTTYSPSDTDIANGATHAATDADVAAGAAAATPVVIVKGSQVADVHGASYTVAAGDKVGVTKGQILGTISVASATDASSTLGTVDTALSTISNVRAGLGAAESRLNSVVNNLTNNVTNLTDARSAISDADFSVETTNLAKAQILSQASTAMLAQANQSQQGVLKLLQ